MSSEIIFDPIKWNRREIVLQSNVAPVVTGGSRVVRKLQRDRTRAVKLKFKFDRDLEVSGRHLALALSTLSGKAYDNIRFGFAVPDSTKLDIEAWTESQVQTAGNEVESIRDLKGAVLNFSGGFDSLAAHYMLPKEHSMVSMGFGGRFGREKKFFRKFSPIQVHTNIVQTSLRKNSWSFIGLGALLSAAETHAQYCTFGSIIESTGFKRDTAHEKGFTFPPFASAGLINAPATQGISEVGTALVIAKHGPELLAPSLKSLASPGEEKLYRKWALAKTALEQVGRPVPFTEVQRPERPHYKFGERLVIDLTAMMIASLGNEELATQLVRGLDSQKVQDARAMNFDFMFKADKRMYAHYPADLKQAMESALQNSGIDWYSKEDQSAVQEFREYWDVKSQSRVQE